MHKLAAWFRVEAHRAYLYRVATAAGGIAAADGLLTGTREALYAGLAATVLSTGTAAAHTSTKG